MDSQARELASHEQWRAACAEQKWHGKNSGNQK